MPIETTNDSTNDSTNVPPVLKCPACGAVQPLTQDDLKTYLKDGFPKHCEVTMHCVAPEN